jgi:hypothetical protein
MRRSENALTTRLSTTLEVGLVISLLGAALVMPLLGDQMVGAISTLIANLHAA